MGPYCLIEHDNLVMYSGPLRTRTAFPLPSLSNRSTDSSAHRSVTRAVAVVGQLLESYGRERKGERTNERTNSTNELNERPKPALGRTSYATQQSAAGGNVRPEFLCAAAPPSSPSDSKPSFFLSIARRLVVLVQGHGGGDCRTGRRGRGRRPRFQF